MINILLSFVIAGLKRQQLLQLIHAYQLKVQVITSVLQTIGCIKPIVLIWSKVQITYDLPKRVLRNTFLREFSAYVSGANLLTISKERKHMEMNVGSAPQTRFYNIGVKAVFN